MVFYVAFAQTHIHTCIHTERKVISEVNLSGFVSYTIHNMTKEKSNAMYICYLNFQFIAHISSIVKISINSVLRSLDLIGYDCL